MMQTRLILGAALIAAQFATVPAFAMTAGVREPFTHIFFTPVDGRVGYRIGAAPLSGTMDDTPAGNSGGPFSGTCRANYGYSSFVGDLPPGITEHPEAGVDMFAGTPRQPGAWTVTVNVVIGCQGGPDMTRYERRVPITFNIEP